jgi:hypothetical protein
MIKRARCFLAAAVALVLSATLAFAQSTVNPGIPAQGSTLSSSPIRGNFTAAYNDINGLLNMHQAVSLAGCSTQTQTVGADCLVTVSPTSYLWYKYSGATNGYVLIGTINPSTSPPIFTSGLPPIANGSLIANCSGATAIPTGCSWTSFADQAISNASGSIPYRTTSWGSISTGTSGHAIPFLDGTGLDFTNPMTTGVAGSVVGGYCMANATSGAVCLAPVTGALGSAVATLPANSGTVAELNLAQTWTAAQTYAQGITVTNSFTATGLVTNADLANPSVTINGTTCTLGSTCTPVAVASSIDAAGATSITNGTANGVLYDSAGVVGVVSPVNNGVLVTSGAGAPSISTTLPSGIAASNMVLTTPNVGVASGTSLAIGGCTLGAAVICATGPTAFNGNAVVTSATSGALTVGLNGNTNPALQIDTSAASSATGVSIASAAAGSGAKIQAISSGTNENLIIGAKGTGSVSITSPEAVALASANALTVGPNGATNPALQVDTSTASAATGLSIKGVAAGSGLSLSTISSGTNEGMSINAKGTGQVNIGNVSTGGVSITNLTANSSFTATGLVTYADMATAAVATASQYQSGAASTLVPAAQIYQGETTITFGTTLAINLTTLTNGAVTLTGNVTTMNFTAVAGKSFQIRFIQDGTGGRTTVFSSVLKFPNGSVPSLSTAAGAVDVLEGSCVSTSYCVASLLTNVQ